jgi:hypothetical protein
LEVKEKLNAEEDYYKTSVDEYFKRKGFSFSDEKFQKIKDIEKEVIIITVILLIQSYF